MVTSRLHRRRHAGATMIEVLVTMVIIAFGLLGMAGLQVRMQSSELESYQRSQALLLLNDMANRMATNRGALLAGSYNIAATAPVGANLPTCPAAGTTTAGRDIAEWCAALQGAAEKVGTTNMGALIGGRGCVEPVNGDYMVTVAWQGMTPTTAPPASVGCGANAFDASSGPCVGDVCRRTVTTLVRVATLITP
jgi:type IV pilus assembly protein PilV